MQVVSFHKKEKLFQYVIYQQTKVTIKRLLQRLTSGLRQFLVSESPLKTIKNDFYFTLKTIFVLNVIQIDIRSSWSRRKTVQLESQG